LNSTHSGFDAVVLGNGLSGVSSAIALHQKGKKVAIVHLGAGATDLSSGSWDFGPIASRRIAFGDNLQTPTYREALSRIGLEGGFTRDFAAYQQGAEALIDALKPTLSFDLNWQLPHCLLSMSGGIRATYCVQSLQSRINLSTSRGRRFGILSSRCWRFRPDLLAREWNARLKQLGIAAEVRAVDIPLESTGMDIPLTRVAADLASSEKSVAALANALSRLDDSVDGYFLPPLFPSQDSFQSVESEVKVPLSEVLAAGEPTAGFRLRRALEQALIRFDIPVFEVKKSQFSFLGDRLKSLSVELRKEAGSAVLNSDHFVLATGRFLGGGLVSSRGRVEESVLSLPLFGLENGKATLGLRADSQFRPTAEDGKAAYSNLFVAGSLLGGVDSVASGFGLGFSAVSGRQCVASIG
jgi:glycerol-3-phosphate dehydrogenase subunit B